MTRIYPHPFPCEYPDNCICRAIVTGDLDGSVNVRREMIATGQADKDYAAYLGPVWDTGELRRDFEVIGFLAPFVVVRRKAGGELGSLEFTDSPRVYFDWREHEK